MFAYWNHVFPHQDNKSAAFLWRARDVNCCCCLPHSIRGGAVCSPDKLSAIDAQARGESNAPRCVSVCVDLLFLRQLVTNTWFYASLTREHTCGRSTKTAP